MIKLILFYTSYHPHHIYYGPALLTVLIMAIQWHPTSDFIMQANYHTVSIIDRLTCFYFICIMESLCLCMFTCSISLYWPEMPHP